MADRSMTCPSCGGSGRHAGLEHAPWCSTCGGSGWVQAGSAGTAGRTGPGFGNPLPGLALLVLTLAALAAPVVAFVVLVDWFVVLGPALRGTFEAMPGDLGVVTDAGGPGSPAVPTVLAAATALGLLVLVWSRHRRSVRAAVADGLQGGSGRSAAWAARGWGILLWALVLVAVAFVATVWAVASGLDLENPSDGPELTHPALVALPPVLAVVVGWLWTRRRLVRSWDRAVAALHELPQGRGSVP